MIEESKLFTPRFTPAGAGNTRIKEKNFSTLTVHPRGCGEYVGKKAQRKTLHGSPPRVRGIQYGLLAELACSRFTPAGAGNTSF